VSIPAEMNESLISDERFGDWRKITNRTLTFYDQGLGLLESEILSPFKEALGNSNSERRYRVLGDPVIRSSLNTALTRVSAGRPASQEHLDPILKATGLLSEAARLSPIEAGAPLHPRLGGEPNHVPIWHGDDRADDDVFGHSFQSLFIREIASGISSQQAVLRTPTAAMRDALEAGYQFLMDAVPEVATSVLRHVHLVAVVDVADESQWKSDVRRDLCQNVSTHAIPGTIFLSPSVLRDPWRTAEALLHEAAHKKLSDLVLTRNIFRPGFEPNPSTVVTAVWNRSLSWNPNDWTVDRALFAAHVYVYLTVFFETLRERHTDIGATSPEVVAKQCYYKAAYLLAELQSFSETELGSDGLDLLGWLDESLQLVADRYPKHDPTVFLLLERYERETRQIGELISRIPNEENFSQGSLEADAPPEQWGSSRIVDHLVHSEIVGAFRILSVLGEACPPQFQFYDGDRWSVLASSRAPYGVRAAVFQGVRQFVISTLRESDASSFDRVCHTRRRKSLRELFADVVTHAERHLDTLILKLRELEHQQKAVWKLRREDPGTG